MAKKADPDVAERPTVEPKPFRYSPQKVYRYVVSGGGPDELVATYEDATVRDQGSQSNWLRAEEAMLRAYSNDPEFFGSEDYRSGNGISTWTQEDEDRYVKDKKYGGAPGDYVVGAVYDCDGDLALKRILMNVVISRLNFGHGSMEYVGFVGEADIDDEEGTDRKGETHDGWGFKQGGHRVERWRIVFAMHDDEGE